MPAAASSLMVTPVTGRVRLAVWADLFKARLTTLVLLTTAAGFYAGTVGSLDFGRLAHTLLGTALLAAGAAALNQLQERDHDARMLRTRHRPLPSGRLSPPTALLVGVACAVTGLGWLGAAVNPLTAALGAATLGIYLLVYTPLKRVTALNTLVGAVPGALPPLMGWTAARGSIDPGGWSLFAILACWQLPHFLAIAWLYREDYARAGFVMLPLLDTGGRRTSRRALGHALILLAVSLIPFGLHIAGPAYLVGALLLGAAFVGAAARFARHVGDDTARRLFYLSILYLPLLLGLLVIDKIK
jgi:heme o synthase